MLKRLTLKLVTLFVLAIALTSVASAPAASANSRTLICFDVPDACIGNEKYCCDRQTGDCGCFQ